MVDVDENDRAATPSVEVEAAANSIAGLSVDEKRALLGQLLAKERDRPRLHPLSEAQERLWLVEQWEPGSATYHSCLAMRLEGLLKITLLQRAFEEVVRRHEMLRTCFSTVAGKPIQAVANQVAIDIPVINLRSIPPGQRDEEAKRQADAEVRRPFDLARGPLFRILLLRLAPDQHDLIFTIHHIAFDGWSAGILLQELFQIMNALAANQPLPLRPLKTQYGAYARWQQQWLASAAVEEQLTYWRETLAGCATILELPTDRPRPPVLRFAGANQHFRLSSGLSERLRELSRREGVTLFMTLLAAYQALLVRYCRQDDVLVGCHTSGRNRAEFEGLIGIFVNTLVIRASFSGNTTFREHLHKLRAAAVSAFAHQDLPFRKVVEAVNPPRDPSRAPLVQVAFGLRNTPWPKLEIDGLKLTPRSAETGTSKFDFTLYMSDLEPALSGRLEYNTELFDPSSAERFLTRFQVLLASICDDIDQPIEKISLSTQQEYQAWLGSLHDRSSSMAESSVVGLIERHAARKPGACAIVWRKQRLTYGELNRQANRLARRLRQMGVGPHTMVGIAVERSLQLPVAVLAVLKSGSAYVPLDAEAAPERLEFIVVDSGVKIILTEESLRPTFKGFDVSLLCVDTEASSPTDDDDSDLGHAFDGTAPAYAIYTSGSTGQPKGAVISHASLSSALQAWSSAYGLLESPSVHLQMAPFSFDVFTGDLVRALGSGGRLVLCPREILMEADQLYALMQEEQITAAEFVPVVLRHLLRHLELNRQRLDFMRLLIVGSDVWHASDHRGARRLCGPQTRIINSYGVTEATIDSCFFEGDVDHLADDAVVPIGKPLANTRLYVLDRGGGPAPAGLPGELYIAGSGVALGFLNRPELQAERFLPDPFVAGPGARMYKTGDLVRSRGDGNLEFIGRVDHQVKIRGFRIELGEIESCLMRHPAVRGAVVAACLDDGGEKRLAAYIVPRPQIDGAASCAADLLTTFIRGKLPDYMLPAAFVLMESLPLTASGKVNRNALPSPDWSRPAAATPYIAPRSPVEAELTRICQEVLRVESVGVNDNFFTLGGDSIRAIQIVGRAARAGWRLTPRQLFQLQTVAAWAAVAEPVDTAGAAANAVEPAPAAPVPRPVSADGEQRDANRSIVEVLPLTPLQQGMLYHILEAPGRGLYVGQVTARLWGVEYGLFREAWQRVIDRHPVLRTGFTAMKTVEPQQMVWARATIPLAIHDWRDRSAAEQTAAWDELIASDWERGFQLQEPPLMRLTMARIDDPSNRLLWTYHQIALDGWSLPLLLQEVLAEYEGAVAGIRPSPLPKRPFRDYLAWLRQQDMQEAEAYWREALHGFHSPTSIRVARPGLHQFTGSTFGDLRWQLDQALTQNLEQTARRHQLALQTIVQGAWAVLLSRYANEDDVVFGQVVSGRPAEIDGVESMIGNLLNTVPVRLNVDHRQPLLPWLREVQRRQIERLQYEWTPLFEIQRWSALPAGTPLFDNIFIFENFPIERTLGRAFQDPASLANAQQACIHRERIHYPVVLQVYPGSVLRLNLLYDRSQLDDAAAQRLLNHFRCLLAGMGAQLDKPGQTLNDLPMLDEAERRLLLEELNATAADYPLDLNVAELFEQRAEEAPHHVAIECGTARLTYWQLNERANQIAHYLRAHGVGHETIVGVCLERCIDLVPALMGVWKAGGAYLPLDPEFPRDRLAFMLADARTSLLITQEGLKDRLPPHEVEMVCLDGEPDDISRQSRHNPARVSGDEQLAYILYTSGSTGVPKGVQVTQRGLVNFLHAMQPEPGLSSADRLLAVTTLSFDIAGLELFLPLMCGATVVIASREQARDGSRLLQLLIDKQITVMQATPVTWRMLIEAGWNGDPVLKVLCGGEALPPDLAQHLLARSPSVWNLYGPTETTIWSTCEKLTPGQEVTIGRPIANTQIYILDRRSDLVPLGVPGELCIGGDGVARGYAHRTDLTENRFGPNPFSKRPRARIYRTGDIARRRADGRVEWIGRADEQVKIRGYRIELGDIEAALMSHPAVRQAVATTDRDVNNDTRLLAYVVPAPGNAPGWTDALKEHISRQLPNYMIPSAFVVLDALPLTVNGKVDRRRLPIPGSDQRDPRQAAAGPVSELQARLAEILGRLLHVERLGVNENLFERGFHSLMAARAVNRINEVFASELAIRDLFERPTIAELANHLSGQGGKAAGSIPALERKAVLPAWLPLTGMQEAFYYQYRLRPDWAINHLHVAARLGGDLDVSALEWAMNEVVRRHDPLRSYFELVGEVPMQSTQTFEAFTLPFVDLSQLSEPDRDKAVHAHALSNRFEPLRMEGPLYRVRLLRLSMVEHVFLFTVHHIVSDGASIDVLLQELYQLYAAARAGQRLPLPELSIRYGDYVMWLNDCHQDDGLERLKDYLRLQLDTVVPLNLATDFPRPRTVSGAGGTVPIELSAELCAAIRQFQSKGGVSAFMILLAGYQAVLQLFSGQHYVNVTSPNANRAPAETEPLIGCFIRMLYINVKVGDDPTFADLVERVRQANFDAYEKQYASPRLLRELVRSLRPDRMGLPGSGRAMFMMLNFMDWQTVNQNKQPASLTITPITAGASGIDRVFLGPEYDEEPTARQAQLADVSAEFREVADIFKGSLHFRTDLFRPTTAERMVRYFIHFLSGGLAEPQKRLSELEILDKEERDSLLARSQSAPPPDDGWRSVSEIITDQARRQPGALAAVCGNARLTYAELERRANQLAHYLRRRGFGPGVRIGICLERSIELVIAVLAAWKTGAAYVPLRPDELAAQLKLIFGNAGIEFVLTQERLESRFDSLNVPWLALDKASTLLDALPLEAPALPDPNGLAYILYTSGSTGEPKGVMIRQSNLIHAWRAWNQVYRLLEWKPTYLQLADFSFDVWPGDVIRALCSGGALVVCPRERTFSGEQIFSLMVEACINAVEIVPVLLRHLMDYLEESGQKLEFLRLIAVGADAWYVKDHERLLRLVGPHCRIFNTYGVTEATIDSAYFEGKWEAARSDSMVPIGQPFPGTSLHVLDERLQPKPVGVWGELYIGGPGVADGYINLPALTAERFILDPFAIETGNRLYKTGDLARWRDDGHLEFGGRLDGQVKINGIRVETSAIESALRIHPAIRDAAVVARSAENTPDKRLIAYVALRMEAPPSVQDLRGFLLQQGLHRHQLPAAYVVLSTLPLLPSGKIDRQSLPEPAQASLLQADYMPPRTGLEQQLATIIGETLGVQAVGAFDDFFALGGNSLKAMQIALRVRRALNISDLPIDTLLSAPSVAELAERISTLPGKRNSTSDRAGSGDLQTQTAYFAYGRGAASRERLPLIAFQNSGPAAPLYLVHGIDGSAHTFADLARTFAGQRPVYGLQAPGMRHIGAPCRSINEMAQHYCQAIRKQMGDAPLFLGGWSAGGMVALEMAHLLKQNGAPPALLVLLDPFYPSKRAKTNLTNLLRQDDTALLPRVLPIIFSFLRVPRRRYETMAPGQRLNLLRKRLHRFGGAIAKIDMALVNSALLVYRAQARALLSYQPVAYEGPVLLVRPGSEAAEPFDHYQPAPRWQRLFADLTGAITPGNHRSMLQGNDSGHLSELLSARFQQLEAPAHPTKRPSSP